MRVLKINTKAKIIKKLYEFIEGDSEFKVKITQSYGRIIPDDIELPAEVQEDIKNKTLLLDNVTIGKKTFDGKKKPVYKDRITGKTFPVKEFERPRIVKPKQELIESSPVNVDTWTKIPDDIAGEQAEEQTESADKQESKTSKGRKRGVK